ncbi:MAG: hypothetical protein ACE5H8_12250 [Alphaproteobacteria bacterium]
MTFASRAFRNIAVTIVVAAALVSVNRLYDLALRDAAFLSGWLLIVGMALLTIYNIRKKFPFLPLISVSAWLQAHIYVGWLVIVLFLLHTSFRLPNGPLEIALWVLFVLVAVSGLAGLALSRTVPNRLNRHGERIIFERIPRFRARLAGEVEELAMRSVTETSLNTISQYYATRLQPYFRGPRNFFAHVVGSNAALIRLRREIGSLEHYLDKQGKEILQEIAWRVAAKDNLDHQYALQWLLKGWLFVHIPLTYGLIVVAVVHAVLAYAFTPGTL